MKDYWTYKCPCKKEEKNCKLYYNKRNLILESDYRHEWCVHCTRATWMYVR